MNKVAVITGASKGIGAATATAFGKAGYDVVINYLKDKTAALAVAKTVEDAGGKALLVQADVFTEAGVKQLFDTAEKEFGKIDVLVNNAARPSESGLGKWTHDSITKSFSGNIFSAALCTQAAIPLLRNGGSILFTASIYGLPFGGHTGLPLYSAGKAAMINFTQTMAEKLAPNIRCNVVAAGYTKTDVWRGMSAAAIKLYHDLTLQKDWVLPEEIADSFVFLANTPHINAQTIVVDGGWQKKIQ